MNWINLLILTTAIVPVSWAEIRQYQAPTEKSETEKPAAKAEVVPTSANQPKSTGGIRLGTPAATSASSAPSVSPSPTLAPKDLKFKQEVESNWNKIMNEFSGKPTAPGLTVFISANDYSAETVKQIRELRKMPELQQLGIQFELYIEEVSDQKGLELFGKDLESGDGLLSDGLEIPVDDDNEKSKAYSVPSGQTTIVYRDATGAVRLYNLRLELDVLRRQLAREVKAAQPAR
jgi:hypothetical protein